MDKTLIEKYTKTYGCRFTRSQKAKFLNELHKDMQELGYESEEIKGKHFLSRSKSYLFGNLKQVKTLIVVPYDTPEKKIWHKVIYYPMDGTRTANKTMLATYVPILILFAVVFIGVYIVQLRMQNTMGSALLSVFMFALTMILVYFMMHGVHNRNNVNRNSASIVCALELAKQLNKDERRRVGFLFTDKNRVRFLGAESSMNYFTEHGKNPNMICLDCIAKGSFTKIGYVPQNRKLASELAKYYDRKKAIEAVKLNDDMRMQSAMSYFKKAVLISTGEVDEEGNLYVMGTGTGKDITMDEENIHQIKQMLYQFIHNQK